MRAETVPVPDHQWNYNSPGVILAKDRFVICLLAYLIHAERVSHMNSGVTYLARLTSYPFLRILYVFEGFSKEIPKGTGGRSFLW